MVAIPLTAVVLAAAEEHETTPSPIIPEPVEIVVGLVAFAILYVVLRRFAVPQFERAFAARTAAIEGGIQKAERAQAEADRQLAEYREQLADARDEANRIREDARAQGAQIVAEMREQAQSEAARITASAQAQLEAERRSAQQTLRAEIGGLATDLASRIVGESLTDEARQRRTVDRFLAELEAAPVTGQDGAASPGAHRAGDSGARETADA